MQIVKSKKVWLLLMFGMALLTIACFLTSGKREKKAYINGRIVENHKEGENTMEICWGEK